MKRMSKRAGRISAMALALTLAAAGCSDSTEPLAFEAIEDVEFDASLEIDLSQMTRTDDGVYYEDLVVGDGAVAEAGTQVTVDYLVRYRTGQQVDAGQFTFTMDDLATAIEGFHEGIRGMRVGGQRRFIVPPELAYGERGPTGILIFDVELLDVTAPAA